MPTAQLSRAISIAFGKKKQTSITTASLAADLWSMSTLDFPVFNISPTIEDNAKEFGKRNEFATESFLTAWGTQGVSLNKHLSIEFVTWLFSFGLGKSTVTGSGPYVYTIVPLDSATDGIELPYFMYVQQGQAIDHALLGCQIARFGVQLSSGPSRQNARATCDINTSGKFIPPPTAITIPAQVSETFLNAASMAVTILTTDYVAAKTLNSLNFEWNSNTRLDEGYYPGSGTQPTIGGAVRGRMESGDRVGTFTFQARYKTGSPEVAALLAQTGGSAVWTLSSGASTITVTFPAIKYRATNLADANGITVVNVDCIIFDDPTNGPITVSSTCPIGAIGQ